MGLFGTKTNSSDDSKDIFGRLGKEEKEGMMVNTLMQQSLQSFLDRLEKKT